MAQVVISKPVGRTGGEYEYLGGSENLGSKGGYHNVQVRFPNLWASDLVQRWLRKRMPNTRAEYLSRFEKFLSWTGEEIGAGTPEELLAWARRQSDGTIVQDLIDEYAEKQTKSSGHIVTALVRSFLGRNGYRELPKIDWEPTLSFTEGYKRADIQQLLAYLPQATHKLYVNMAKDSGLRANDLLYTRYKHLQEDLEAGQTYVHIRFEKERYLRRKSPGRTFIGPNTITLLRQLIKSGQVKTNPDSKILPFSYRSVTFALSLAKKKAGLNSEIQPSHGLRKYFENCLDRVGMDHSKKSQLEGHSLGVRGAYTSRDVEELRELYAQAYTYLDLSEEAAAESRVKELEALVKKTNEENSELKNKLTNTAGELARLNIEFSDTLKVLTKRIEALEKKEH